jgi:hypothetical protein
MPHSRLSSPHTAQIERNISTNLGLENNKFLPQRFGFGSYITGEPNSPLQSCTDIIYVLG